MAVDRRRFEEQQNHLPARELCSILPAWRGAKALCSRLGDHPLAHPVTRDALEEFVQAVEQARE
jgi:hypothetical protein